MSQLLPLELDTASILQQWLAQQEEVFEFSDDDYSSLLICYILTREIGSLNDSLSPYIYDAVKKQKIDRHDLIVNIKTSKPDHLPVVQIVAPQVKRLGITLSYLREMVNCYNNEIIISPKRIASYLHSHGLTPVLVAPWIQQIIFSEFDVRSEKVGDQLWVLRNNDIYLYSKLVAQRKIVFQSSHDVVGHIAGTKAEGAIYAAEIATEIHTKLHNYFGDTGRGNLPSHLIPFLIGLLLDDLTQPPTYFSVKHTQAIQEFLIAMEESDIDPHAALVLNGFPARINIILQMIREKTHFSISFLRTEIKKLVLECKELTSLHLF